MLYQQWITWLANSPREELWPWHEKVKPRGNAHARAVAVSKFDSLNLGSQSRMVRLYVEIYTGTAAAVYCTGPAVILAAADQDCPAAGRPTVGKLKFVRRQKTATPPSESVAAAAAVLPTARRRGGSPSPRPRGKSPPPGPAPAPPAAAAGCKARRPSRPPLPPPPSPSCLAQPPPSLLLTLPLCSSGRVSCELSGMETLS